jgi:hypothetical protein
MDTQITRYITTDTAITTDMILITELTITGGTTHSTTAVGTHLYFSVSVSVTDGIIIITDGTIIIIITVTTITGLHTIHATIITETIITHTGIHQDLTHPDGARVTFLNLPAATAMFREERAPHVLLQLAIMDVLQEVMIQE